MHRINVAMAFALLVGISMLIAPVLSEGISDLVGSSSLTWRGEVQGQAYEFNGTLDEVWGNLKERHPDIEDLLKLDEVTFDHLAQRSPILPPLCCPVPGQRWFPASFGALIAVTKQLVALNNEVFFSHGCQTIAINCASPPAPTIIDLCMDNPGQMSVWSTDLADLGYYLAYGCIGGNNDQVCGQVFDTRGFNLIVRQLFGPVNCP